MAVRKPWKAAVSEGLVQLAVILSILRTDVRQYMRSYRNYPEIQQVLQGDTIGLNLVGNYHRDLSRFPVKHIEDRESILSEISRLATIPSRRQLLDTWLVTESASTATAFQPSSASSHTSELSRQDIDLIELLWKHDAEFGATNSNVEAQMNLNNNNDENFYQVDSLRGDEGVLADVDGMFADTTHGYQEVEPHASLVTPPCNHQNSLELELQDLDTLPYHPLTFGDISVPEPHAVTFDDNDLNSLMAPEVDFCQSGLLMDDSFSDDPMQLTTTISRQFSSDSMGEIYPSLLDDLGLNNDDIDVDVDLFDNDFEEMLSSGSMRKSISEDSAYTSASSSPSRTYSDRLSESSGDDLGAVGFTDVKSEPFYDDYLYEAKPYIDMDMEYHTKDVVSHDHTYGAPPGGVPHVRKMDIKIPKVPTRGFAHDEIMVKKLKVPFSVEKIIDSPVEEFSKLLTKYPLNSKQAKLVKDIRRRGKNKVAAQNCRMKKIGEITDLEQEVDALRLRRDAMRQQKLVLAKKSSEMRKRVDLMSSEIFQTLRNEDGVPYSLSSYTLDTTANGEVVVRSLSEGRRSSRKDTKKSSKRH